MLDSNYMKACVAAYLRYGRQCPIVAFERGIAGSCDNPDVLAVTKQRQLIEVEVKISLSDFKHDAVKAKWLPARQARMGARQFFYAVPPELVDKVQAVWPHPDRGLLTLDRHIRDGLHVVRVVRGAKPVAAKTLTTQQLLQMVRHQSGTLVSLARDCAAMQAMAVSLAERGHGPQ